MNADLSDLLRLLQNLIRLGTIAEVKGAKARVRLGPTLTTEWLKWATRRAGSTRTAERAAAGVTKMLWMAVSDTHALQIMENECASYGIELPEFDTMTDTIARLVDARWWRRQLRKRVKRAFEAGNTGELAKLMERIRTRKATHNVVTSALLTNMHGKRLTTPALRSQFDAAKKQAASHVPELAQEIMEFWFYNLRAKAADDTSDDRSDQAASDLLGHDSVKTTQRHYLRRGKIVAPTK
ncbi:hypothetical protein [Janthinobacterium sp. RT4P48]|uniref:hypothetical protein n=1 Tax=Janthinobacterium sp. RT4P48 TaxID=3424188 RepID=UPI003F1F64F8